MTDYIEITLYCIIAIGVVAMATILIGNYIYDRRSTDATFTSTATIEPECVREPVKEKSTYRRTKFDLIALAKAEAKRQMRREKRLYWVKCGGCR